MSILDEKILYAKKICILGHQNPDGDCIGATLAIYNYIKAKYGQEKIVKPFLNEFSNKFLILPNANVIKNDANDAEVFDLAIVVDSSSVDRFKDFERYFNEARDTIVFDHHKNNTVPARTSVIFEDAISTCEVLYDFFDKSFIDREVATCLYIGIATDSGVFRYKAVTKKTFNIVGELISKGLDFSELLDKIVFDNTISQRKAQGLAFDRLKTLCHGRVSFTYLDDNDLDSLNVTNNDIDNIIVYVRELTGIKIAAFAYQTGQDIFKISLRSKYEIYDVADFAKMHDGGGHTLAAGCLYYGNIDEVIKKFEIDIGQYIDEKDSIK